jgi:DNA-binding transcriptional ArsR family regulator
MKEPRVVPRRAERLAIARLLLELTRVIYNSRYTGSGEKPFGTEIDIVFVGACVAIGDLEHRPMSASDIAAYIDMPRTTVQRKLKQLVRRDIVTRHGTKFWLSSRLIASADAFVEAANRAIRKAQPKQ